MDATPVISFPINFQYPTVARINDAYSFSLSDNTFSSQSPISYSADGLPSWLSFDNSTLTLSGTPNSSNAGFANFTVAADDGSGSVSDYVTLIISTNAAPTVEQSCEEQFQSYITYNGKGGLTLKPESEFLITFSNETFFDPASKIVAYYGLSSGQSPLPSWIQFDASSLTFSGIAPAIASSIAPAQDFYFELIATDYAGYAAAMSSFYLTVGYHQLEISESSYVVNATASKQFTLQIPYSSVILDGNSITNANISSATANTTSWMSFDSSKLELTGTPPKDQTNSTVVIIDINDVYGDSIQASVLIDIFTSANIFSGSFANANATEGNVFNYTLNSSVISGNFEEIYATYNPSSASSWLSFDNTTLEFSGDVPTVLLSVQVTITAVDITGKIESESFYIEGISKTSIPSSSSSAATPSASTSVSSSISAIASAMTSTLSRYSTATSTPSVSSSASASVVNTSSKNSSNSSNHKTAAIAAGVTVPLAVLAALLILFFCWRSRRYSKSRTNSPQLAISLPILIEDDWPLPPKSPWDSPGGMSYNGYHEKLDDGMSGFVLRYDPSNVTGIDAVQRPDNALIVDDAPAGTAYRSSRWNNFRDSLTSLASVATNEIFSLRLVESSHSDLASVLSPSRSFSNPSRGTNVMSSRGSMNTIGEYSFSSPDSSPNKQNLEAVKEEDIRDFIGAHRPTIYSISSDRHNSMAPSNISGSFDSVDDFELSHSQDGECVSTHAIIVKS